MQRAVVTEQMCVQCDPNVKQEKVMFNLAAVRSAVPLRERRLSALATTVQWPYQLFGVCFKPHSVQSIINFV
jgi:hypothetical protein